MPKKPELDLCPVQPYEGFNANDSEEAGLAVLKVMGSHGNNFVDLIPSSPSTNFASIASEVQVLEVPYRSAERPQYQRSSGAEVIN